MKFCFVWVGKAKDKNWKALQDEYLRRLSHFVRCEIIEIKDSTQKDGKQSESQRILEILNQKSFVCLLDVTGKSLASPDLAAQIEKWQDRSIKEITFVIGGAGGVSAEISQKADFSLSLSFLTFTHDMARVVMLEQLYRAFTILKGFPYQK